MNASRLIGFSVALGVGLIIAHHMLAPSRAALPEPADCILSTDSALVDLTQVYAFAWSGDTVTVHLGSGSQLTIPVAFSDKPRIGELWRACLGAQL